MSFHSVKVSNGTLSPVDEMSGGAHSHARDLSSHKHLNTHDSKSYDSKSYDSANTSSTPDLVHSRNQQSSDLSSQPYHNPMLAYVQRNQLRISKALLFLLYSTHYFSRYLGLSFVHAFTSKFLHLQYGVNSSLASTVYDLGEKDTFAIIHGVILLTFLRLFLMQCCFGPFATIVCKIRSKKAGIRFQEQSWSFVYYSVSFLYGGILYYNLEYYLNLDELYRGWPHDQMLFAFKWYYLMQMSFIIQQILVLNVEQRRKDHYQMFSHHIITCLLLLGLYFYYFTRVGHCILLMMDSVDIFLSAAKMLNYTGMRTACDAMFLLFLVSWVVIRHGVYNLVYYHMWHYLGLLMADSNCSSPAHPSKRCWTQNIINVFLGLLGGLQVITLIWMYLIFKVAYKVVTGTGAEDVRSDDDDTDVEDENNNDTNRDGNLVKEPQTESSSSSGNNSCDEKTL